MPAWIWFVVALAAAAGGALLLWYDRARPSRRGNGRREWAASKGWEFTDALSSPPHAWRYGTLRGDGPRHAYDVATGAVPGPGGRRLGCIFDQEQDGETIATVAAVRGTVAVPVAIELRLPESPRPDDDELDNLGQVGRRYAFVSNAAKGRRLLTSQVTDAADRVGTDVPLVWAEDTWVLASIDPGADPDRVEGLIESLVEVSAAIKEAIEGGGPREEPAGSPADEAPTAAMAGAGPRSDDSPTTAVRGSGADERASSGGTRVRDAGAPGSSEPGGDAPTAGVRSPGDDDDDAPTTAIGGAGGGSGTQDDRGRPGPGRDREPDDDRRSGAEPGSRSERGSQSERDAQRDRSTQRDRDADRGRPEREPDAGSEHERGDAERERRPARDTGRGAGRPADDEDDADYDEQLERFASGDEDASPYSRGGSEPTHRDRPGDIPYDIEQDEPDSDGPAEPRSSKGSTWRSGPFRGR